MTAEKGAPETDRSIQIRMFGLVLVGLVLFTLDGQSTSPLHTLFLPLVMAVGAACALRNVLAVALAVIALAGIRSDFDNPDWVPSLAYPALTLAAFAVAATLLIKRFRARMIATRDARNARRK